MEKRGQVESLDFLLALFMFSIVLMYAISLLNDSNTMVLEKTEFKYMLLSATQISDSLVKNPGVPSDWNQSTVELIGLASGDRIISGEKVSFLCNMSQNNIRSLLRTSYYFQMALVGNGTTVCGVNASGTKAVSVRRYVMYNNQNATLYVTLWK